MHSTFRFKLAGALLAAFLATQAARATTVGLSTDPMQLGWDRGDINSAYAIWDTFPNVGMGANGPLGNFLDDAPDTTSGLTNPLLDQSSEGPLRTGSGDRIYTFGSSPVWTITGETLFGVKGFVLQMKQYQDPGLSLDLLYAPTLNGILADYYETVTFTEGANTNSVTTWYWGASIASQSFTNFTVEIADQSANHYSIDAISIDAGTVAVVPEPTAATLLGGTGLLFLMRRRRSAASLAT